MGERSEPHPPDPGPKARLLRATDWAKPAAYPLGRIVRSIGGMPTIAPAPPAPRPPTSSPDIDRSLATLAERAPAWAALPLDDRIGFLRSLHART